MLIEWFDATKIGKKTFPFALTVTFFSIIVINPNNFKEKSIY